MAAKALVEVQEARRMILATLAAPEPVPVELDGALARVLAEDVVAERALPPFDSSAMDGFAVRAADVAGAAPERPAALELVGESRAGSPAGVGVASGEAVAISTGAIVPEGADAVVRVESTRSENGRVEVLEAVPPGSELRRAGEDVRAGATVLARGAVLGPAQLAMLASLGRPLALCAPRPRVSVLVTGDELLAPGERSRPGAVRDCNSLALTALARCAGADVVRTSSVGDERAATVAAIAEAVGDSDLLVTCGGASVGAHDHVRPSLRELGASERFFGLALRPGHPTWFGTLDGVPVLALPGNPVSAMVTFVLLARPALAALQGASDPTRTGTAVLDAGYRKPAGRAHALRCRLRAQEDGWHAELTGPQGSHVLSSMLAADALAIVPSATSELERGARVEIVALGDPTGAFA